MSERVNENIQKALPNWYRSWQVSSGAGIIEQVGSMFLLTVDWVGLLPVLPAGQVTVPCFQCAALC